MLARWLVIASTAGSFALAGSAFPHDWYPRECCDERDCEPMPEEFVERRPEGYYIIPLDRVIPYEAANTSPDGQFHWCRFRAYESPIDRLRSATKRYSEFLNRSKICFFAPDAGM